MSTSRLYCVAAVTALGRKLKMNADLCMRRRRNVARIAKYLAEEFGLGQVFDLGLGALGQVLKRLVEADPLHPEDKNKKAHLGSTLGRSEMFIVNGMVVTWNLVVSSSAGSEEGPIVVDPSPTQLYDAIIALPAPPAQESEQAEGQLGASDYDEVGAEGSPSKKRRPRSRTAPDNALPSKRQLTTGAFTPANQTHAQAGGAAAATAAAAAPELGLLAPPHGPRGCGLSGSMGPLLEQPRESQRSVEAHDDGQAPAGQAFVPLPKEPQAHCQYQNTTIKLEMDDEGWRQQSADNVAKYDAERQGWEAQHPGQRSVEAPDGRQVPAGQQGVQLKEKDEEILSLKKYAEHLQAYNTALQADLTAERARVMEAQQSSIEMQGQLAELGGKVRSLEQLLAYEREQVAKLRNEREAAMRDMATLRADLDNTRQERDRVIAELAKAKEDLDRVREAAGKNAT